MEKVQHCCYSPKSGRPAKMTTTAQRRTLNEVKNPRVSAKDLQKSLDHANISVDESTIRKTLNKNGVYGRTPRNKPLLSKKQDLCCTSDVLKRPPGCSTALLEIYSVNRLKLSCLEGTHNTMCGEKKGTAHQLQNFIPNVKYGGGSIMVCGCFAASGPG